MRSSPTYDRGKEVGNYEQLSANTGMAVYFCDRHSPRQRGTNENPNGLIRQYQFKGTGGSGDIQDELEAVADQMNGPPQRR